MRQLKKAYLEITNVCNLSCDFCPKNRRRAGFLSLEGFRVLAGRLRPHMTYLYLHLMGEPLLHPQLAEILEIGADLEFRVMITTNGTLLPEQGGLLCASPAVEKVSVSLHSFEGNEGDGLDRYLEQCIRFAKRAGEQGKKCALRLWNLDGADIKGDNCLNGRILAALEKAFPGPWREGARGRPWLPTSFWSGGSGSDGLTCPPRSRGSSPSATACETRWAYCGTGQWCPAAWIMRGISPWGTSIHRRWRKFWTALGPRLFTTAFPGGGLRRSCAAGAALPGDFNRRRERSLLDLSLFCQPLPLF